MPRQPRDNFGRVPQSRNRLFVLQRTQLFWVQLLAPKLRGKRNRLPDFCLRVQIRIFLLASRLLNFLQK